MLHYKKEKPIIKREAPNPDIFREQGYIILKDVVPHKLLDELQSRIDKLEYNPPGDDFHPSFRYKNVFNRDPWWLQWLDLQEPITFVESILGNNCHVIANTAWKSLPEHLGSPTHIDYIPSRLTLEQAKIFTYPCFIITAHFFPHQLTEEIGPTRVIPGSHVFGGNYWELDKMISLFPEPGDCLLFRSDLLHAGGANKSSWTRYLLQVHYGQRWISQRFGGPDWNWNKAVINTASERQLRLLGKHMKSNYD